MLPKLSCRDSDCDEFTDVCVCVCVSCPGYPSQCARCNKEMKEIALMEASISSMQKTQQDIQRWGGAAHIFLLNLVVQFFGRDAVDKKWFCEAGKNASSNEIKALLDCLLAKQSQPV